MRHFNLFYGQIRLFNLFYGQIRCFDFFCDQMRRFDLFCGQMRRFDFFCGQIRWRSEFCAHFALQRHYLPKTIKFRIFARFSRKIVISWSISLEIEILRTFRAKLSFLDLNCKNFIIYVS